LTYPGSHDRILTMNSAPNDQDRFKEAADAFDAVELQNQKSLDQSVIIHDFPQSRKRFGLTRVHSFITYMGNPDKEGPLVILVGVIVLSGLLRGHIPL
jgi:hypothetical protein